MDYRHSQRFRPAWLRSRQGRHHARRLSRPALFSRSLPPAYKSDIGHGAALACKLYALAIASPARPHHLMMFLELGSPLGLRGHPLTQIVENTTGISHCFDILTKLGQSGAQHIPSSHTPPTPLLRQRAKYQRAVANFFCLKGRRPHIPKVICNLAHLTGYRLFS
jgi:hypothetical protein